MRTVWILAITFLASSGLAGDKPVPTKWFGNVTYSHTIVSNWSGTNPQKKSDAEVSCSRSANIWTYIHFCIDSKARQSFAKGQVGYQDVTTKKKSYAEHYRMCPAEKKKGNWHPQHKKVSPGDTEDININKSTHLTQDPNTTGYNEMGKYGVRWMPGDGVLSFGVITVFADIAIKRKASEKIEGNMACGGKGPKSPKDQKPMTLGRRMAVGIPMNEPKMTFSGQKTHKNISGKDGEKYKCNYRKVPSKKINGSYTEREVSTWYMTSDGCEYVKNHMDGIKKLKDIFDQIVAESDGQTSQQIQDNMNQKLGQATQGAQFSPMRTYPQDCKIYPAEQEAFRSMEEIEERYYKCLPNVVFESDILHEGVHQKACAKANGCTTSGTGESGQQLIGNCQKPGGYANNTGDPGGYAQEDSAAYTKQYNHLKNWYDQHCQGK
jgi:hypothetical protein